MPGTWSAYTFPLSRGKGGPLHVSLPLPPYPFNHVVSPSVPCSLLAPSASSWLRPFFQVTYMKPNNFFPPPYKGENGRWLRPGVAPAEQPWGPIRRDGCLRVLARTERADCRRSCASFPPFLGSIAMSPLYVARWQMRARHDRMAVHPRAFEPGSRHHTWHGGLLPPGYSWQQS